jgi:hypothetical protein
MKRIMIARGTNEIITVMRQRGKPEAMRHTGTRLLNAHVLAYTLWIAMGQPESITQDSIWDVPAELADIYASLDKLFPTSTTRPVNYQQSLINAPANAARLISALAGVLEYLMGEKAAINQTILTALVYVLHLEQGWTELTVMTAFEAQLGTFLSFLSDGTYTTLFESAT